MSAPVLEIHLRYDLGVRFAAMIAVGASAFVVGAPAFAKDGEVAHLLVSPSAHARAGSLVTVRWTVDDESRGSSEPFAAVGMFVRLVGPGGATQTALAKQYRPPYSAHVRVPSGGITRIELGLQGWASTKSGTHYAPVLFPVR